MTQELNQTAAPEETVTVGDQTFPISALPENMQQLIRVYEKWGIQLNSQREEVFKLEAAIKAVTDELNGLFQEYVKSLETSSLEKASSETEKPKKKKTKKEE